MPHQWLEGNLPVAAKCDVCDKTCGSVLRGRSKALAPSVERLKRSSPGALKGHPKRASFEPRSTGRAARARSALSCGKLTTKHSRFQLRKKRSDRPGEHEVGSG
ncbi:Diacylglycerol kinase delta [Eumeta japonica]|uniref:Diacylglycerol kinase delta n=1 Tax=Eumeta variegata TaxID=151549 RepID=A0A4C1TEG8_EUMVA|nr:Diacylglycerol kinase delta [Eumeta japonica]